MDQKPSLLVPAKRKPRSDKGKKRKGALTVHKCPKCDFSSSAKDATLVHYLNYHAGPAERKLKYKYYCELCDFGVMFKGAFTVHQKTKKHQFKVQLDARDSSHD